MKKKKSFWLTILMYVAIYSAVLFLLAYLEARNPDGNIKSFSDALWFSIVTLTTVGYGDFYPTTYLGKFVGLTFIIGSLGLLGFIISRATDEISQARMKRKMGQYGTDFENHIVFIGWNSFSRSIVEQLILANSKVAIITDTKDDIELIYSEFSDEHVFCFFSDLANVQAFKGANIEKSAIIFVNLKDDSAKLISVLNIKKFFPRSRFMVSLQKSELKDTFYAAGTSFVLSNEEISSRLIASYIFEPDVANLTTELITISQSQNECDIKEYKVTETNPYLNKTFGECFNDLKAKYNTVTIGVCKLDEKGVKKLHKLPPDNLKIELNDFLLLIMNNSNKEEICDVFDTVEGVINS